MDENYDYRVRPLLLVQAKTRHASEWNYDDAEIVIRNLLADLDDMYIKHEGKFYGD